MYITDTSNLNEITENLKPQSKLRFWGVVFFLIGIIFFMSSDTFILKYEEYVSQYNEEVSVVAFRGRYDDYLEHIESDEYATARKNAVKLKVYVNIYKFLMIMGEKGSYILMFSGALMIIIYEINEIKTK